MPLWHTTLLAKCSVLYLLSWLRGEAGCDALHALFTRTRKQTVLLQMGMNEKSGYFQKAAEVYESPRPSSYAPTYGQSAPKCGQTPGKVAGQRATVKAVNSGTYTPFILTVDRLGWICYFRITIFYHFPQHIVYSFSPVSSSTPSDRIENPTLQ